MTIFYENTMYTALMKKKSQRSTPTESGKRLAAFRKAAGLSQVQLAAMVDIPQRTLSFYETTAESIPSSVVPTLAEALGVSRQTVNELLRERRSLSPEMALGLSALFGNSPEFWLNLQRSVDLWDAQDAVKDEMRRIKPLCVA